MKGNLGCLIGISLFLGFAVFGTTGMLIPSIFRITTPLVCNGRMEIEKREYSYRPGDVTTQNNFYCINAKTGEKREISFPTMVVGCLIFSAISLSLMYTYALFQRFKRRQPGKPLLTTTPPASPPDFVPLAKTEPSSEDASKVLKELKELRAADLISEQEYQAKKTEILSRM